MTQPAYRKEGRLRPFGMGGIEITVPRVIMARAAEAEGQSVEEFRKTHKVVHLYNAFPNFTAAYRFERDEDQEILEISDGEARELAGGPFPERMADRIARLREKLEGSIKGDEEE